MPEWVLASIKIITLAVMLTGLFGLVIPVFPGMLILWLAALSYGVVSGFGVLGGWMFGLITLLALVGMTIDNVLMGAGAKQGGASWTGIALGMLAGLVGTLLLPPVGGLIAAPGAIFLYEYRRLGDRDKALASLKGLALGWGAAFLARFGLGVIMILLWAVWAWRG